MILKSKHLSCHYFWRHDVSGKRGVLWQKWEWGLMDFFYYGKYPSVDLFYFCEKLEWELMGGFFFYYGKYPSVDLFHFCERALHSS